MQYDGTELVINGIELVNFRTLGTATFSADIILNKKKIGFAIDRNDGLGMYIRIPDPVAEARFERTWQQYFRQHPGAANQHTEAAFILVLVNLIRSVQCKSTLNEPITAA